MGLPWAGISGRTLVSLMWNGLLMWVGLLQSLYMIFSSNRPLIDMPIGRDDTLGYDAWLCRDKITSYKRYIFGYLLTFQTENRNQYWAKRSCSWPTMVPWIKMPINMAGAASSTSTWMDSDLRGHHRRWVRDRATEIPKPYIFAVRIPLRIPL